MNKKTKWGIIALIGVGIIGMAIHAFLPRGNKDLSQAPNKTKTSNRSRTLNVIGEIIKESSISDGTNITGLLLPDEEVNLSFETSGKITSINVFLWVAGTKQAPASGIHRSSNTGTLCK